MPTPAPKLPLAHLRPARLAGLCLAGLLAVACNAQAQTAWPNKPIRLVIGFAPGGAADFVARSIADPLGRTLGQTVVVDNRAGAGSSLAADFVAKAPADGYTLLIASPSSISVNPALNPRLSYSAKDLLPAMADGRIQPLVDSVFAFDDLPAAQARMQANQHLGKIVLRIAD